MSIPRRDPTLTVKDLKKTADAFGAAGLAHWEMAQKTGLCDGAVVWVQNEDGSLVIFTRGEYADTLRNAVSDGGVRSVEFGGHMKE